MEGSPLRFDGRVAIVTGAGRGLGRAYALALAERGAKLVVNDSGGALSGVGSDPGPAGAVVEEIVAAGGEAVAQVGDVADPAAGEAMVEAALKAFGGVDVVVNNAGNMDPRPLVELSVADLEKHFGIHALGARNVTAAAWPHLVASGSGRVVVTTSIGLFGGPFIAAYSTAKAAAWAFGRSLAPAAAEHGIKVNLLAPVAETRMVIDPELRAKVGLPALAAGHEPDPARGPAAVVPMLLALAHESCPVNGETLGAGLGRFARIFVAETPGLYAPGIGPEELLARWAEVVDETGYVVQMSTADSVAYREALISAHAERSEPGTNS
ncbi:MAG TPA: SDR family NAD(P)-dependent oxidoreductase [Solirubrobacterales bacterium]|jgi:NAD(P)-dependent dehydrogenase (short-subunit alcohol dehydrogenase family)